MQAEELTLPIGELALLPHAVHELSVFAIKTEYVPLVQFRQTLTPDVVEYLPLAHRRHSLTPKLDVPQAQSLSQRLPVHSHHKSTDYLMGSTSTNLMVVVDRKETQNQ